MSLLSTEKQSLMQLLIVFVALAVTLADNEEAEVTDNEGGKDEPLQNETVYECLGPSKEDMKLYGKLAWWMDGVIQVGFWKFKTQFDLSLYVNSVKRVHVEQNITYIILRTIQ